MANVAIGSRNLADEATITSGAGSWLAALPASNVGLRDRSKVARSTSASTSNTKLRLALPSAMSIRLVALFGTNLSSAAQLKVDLGSSAGGTQAHAGTLTNAWQFTPRAYDGRRHGAWYVLPSAVSATYLDIIITDSSNSAGYVDIARVWYGDVWQPTINADYGLKRPLQAQDGKARSKFGTVWPDARPSLRGAQFVLSELTASEADEMHELQRYCGTAQEILYAEDLGNAANTQRYGCLGTLDELTPVELPDCGQYSSGFKHTEG